MITITEQAKAKIADILAEENNPALRVRAFVQGGGCSGFQYGFTLDEEQGEDDFDVEGVEEDKLKTDIDGYEYVSHSERLFFLDEYVDDIFAQHNSIED